jgi:preprotein translocase subunit SecY
MLEKLANIFRVPDLRKRVLFTLGLLAVYRIGGHIPTPGINGDRLAEFFERNKGTALGFVDMFSGGNLRKLTIFALGIMPYITASIILQLLTVVYEPLAKLQKEGEMGRKKITQWTRYLTVLLSAVQSFGIAVSLQHGGDFVNNPGPGFVLMTMLTLTTGSAFIMWLGEQITERGIGNGMSLLIFAGIVVGLPRGVIDLYQKVQTNAWGVFTAPGILMLLVLMVAVVAFIVFVERSERRIPVQYAKRVVGRKVMGGQSTHLPLRVNAGGVMPVIFASSIITLPQMLGAAFHNNKFIGPVLDWLRWGEPLYTLCYCLGIIFFAYFYISIVFNPNEVADNMRKWGGFVPGIRPGKRTADFINDVLTRLTLVGALYLIIISLIPEWMLAGIRLNHLWLVGRYFENLPSWVTNGLGVNFYFGGTSLLIVVGVAMDTVTQIEAQLIMRHYDGFTPKSGRIRGRRTW